MNEFRITKQRKIILEELSQCFDHPPADDIYLKVRQKLPNISLGTVYRNLQLMSEQGMILKIETPDGQKRFDYNTAEHPHFHCESCGRIEDIPYEIKAPVLDDSLEWVQQRKVKSASLHYSGLCAKCSK